MINYRNGRRMIQCSTAGCTTYTSRVSGLCLKHYKQQWYLKKVGRTELLDRPSKGRWIHKVTGYVLVEHNHRLEYEHRVLAEKALGRPLPKGVVVHHMGAPDDNHGPFKLIVCPNQEYHFLLHKRMEECGS